MKKVITIIGIVIICGIGLYFVAEKLILKSMETEVSGRWELVDGEGCIEDMNIRDGLKDSRVMSFYNWESASVEAMYMALYELTDDEIRVTEITNYDDVEPFTMTYELATEDTLHTSYDWNEESFTCSYERQEE